MGSSVKFYGAYDLWKDPGVFVGIGLNLCAVDIGMVQIYTQLTQNIAVDIIENSIHTA